MTPKGMIHFHFLISTLVFDFNFLLFQFLILAC